MEVSTHHLVAVCVPEDSVYYSIFMTVFSRGIGKGGRSCGLDKLTFSQWPKNYDLNSIKFSILYALSWPLIVKSYICRNDNCTCDTNGGD